ncbi:MAG: sulfide/dihydroorotate dehydrogenase-like FAD/NAD-binding protein [Clostridium sp.]|jgi:NAD(P)H-flavin reductase|uniref:sulfide/dihydroorotate dehydrogenase-like FAD/NAD-binding protein n=1 Tax=Clostridium sp. TaxID=1506 RepID=UPI0025BAC96F|nr:sulfide/dihydroorotate dehydrogenase-like FAD/NAD-binding protein [Clostridium sp.]MCH3964864.1 sulfide/dihydroorotate dehydrogenase-like FAD/NAD-binding protein [Clostridium sp.]MCI1716641.1 sulfide/dihydroorotate dehydrogenase-like FAD/NAD-binding protein [Clostridium sp.]MCI1800877.1 sulfide/dihydroorotate dehydrogenase-like FAD/NAD-binding protein [Clostridium sp.]MCI1814818.1 sulfide/dihydroorotate dehydrogenase-like FAD/NAD-binding protein [Clostridium sp.]MCI1871624.1 sulfide/dihydro
MYCIDAGSIYCPCHLAETLDCILCSQLSGGHFCQCKNWCGVCIYEKYISNGNRPNNLRKTYSCLIEEKEVIEEDLYSFVIDAPENLVRELIYPGSFVFLRKNGDPIYYDVPLSIMEADKKEKTLKVMIKTAGTKTKSLLRLNKGDYVLVRGPFSNGIMGLSNIYKAKNGVSIVAARGIGIVPSIHVMKELHSNNNRVISIVDTQFKNNFGEKYFKEYSSETIYCDMLEDGKLTENFRSILEKIISENAINIIHCGGPDILTYNILEFADDTIRFSCCNNAKMSCGEGICASCTKHYENDVVKRLCKVQIDPRDLFKDRRLF